VKNNSSKKANAECVYKKILMMTIIKFIYVFMKKRDNFALITKNKKIFCSQKKDLLYNLYMITIYLKYSIMNYFNPYLIH